MIVTNRMVDELEDIKDKVYTRDLFNDNLTFIIPVFLKTIGDEALLLKTIEKISTISSDIVVISQGIKPRLNNKKIKNYHSNSSLGKWKAVSYAKRFQLNNFIFIHDGDNPFKEESYKKILKFKRNTFIQRDEIILYSQDELSRESRKYIELFLNKYSSKTQGMCVDIQSGGLILERDIFKELSFSSFGDYGGELIIYNYLIKHNIPVDMITMKVEMGKCRQKSNYTIEGILQSIIRTPLSVIEVSEILQICVQDCKKYIRSNHKFKTEVLYFLNKYNMIF